jgi:hypothetical protein
MGNAETILYLDTRTLAGERIAQVSAALALGLNLVVATPTPGVFRSFGCVGIIPTKLGNYDVAEKNILNYLRKHRIELNGIVAWKDLEVELASRLSHGDGKELLTQRTNF